MFTWVAKRMGVCSSICSTAAVSLYSPGCSSRTVCFIIFRNYYFWVVSESLPKFFVWNEWNSYNPIDTQTMQFWSNEVVAENSSPRNYKTSLTNDTLAPRFPRFGTVDLYQNLFWVDFINDCKMYSTRQINLFLRFCRNDFHLINTAAQLPSEGVFSHIPCLQFWFFFHHQQPLQFIELQLLTTESRHLLLLGDSFARKWNCCFSIACGNAPNPLPRCWLIPVWVGMANSLAGTNLYHFFLLEVIVSGFAKCQNRIRCTHKNNG